MTKNVEISSFVWAKHDHFCEGYTDRFGKHHPCGKAIGVWSSKHSKRCQGCNLLLRMEKEKAALERVGQ